MTRRFARDDELTDNQEGKVDPRYLAEVDRMTARRQQLHARRERVVAALVEAEARVDAAKRAGESRAAIRAAWQLVKERREELARLEKLMQSHAGASSSHRGNRSIWPTHAEDSVAREPDRDTTRIRDGRPHPVTRSGGGLGGVPRS